MDIEEKKREMTKRVKLKLDEIEYRITDIMSHLSKDKLHRDLTRKDAIVTSFTEAKLYRDVYVISDPDTLEMLYVQTGPMNFVDIDVFFKPR